MYRNRANGHTIFLICLFTSNYRYAQALKKGKAERYKISKPFILHTSV